MDQNVHLKKKPEWLKYYSRGAQKMYYDVPIDQYW